MLNVISIGILFQTRVAYPFDTSKTKIGDSEHFGLVNVSAPCHTHNASQQSHPIPISFSLLSLPKPVQIFLCNFTAFTKSGKSQVVPGGEPAIISRRNG